MLSPALLKEVLLKCTRGPSGDTDLKERIEKLLEKISKYENPALHKATKTVHRELLAEMEEELGGSVNKQSVSTDLFEKLSRAFNMNGRDCTVFMCGFHFVTRTMDDKASSVLNRFLGENRHLKEDIANLQKQKESLMQRKKIVRRSSPRKLTPNEQIQTLEETQAFTVEYAQVEQLQQLRNELLEEQDASAERTVLDADEGDIGCDDSITSELQVVSDRLEQALRQLQMKMDSIRVLDDGKHQAVQMRKRTLALEETIGAAIAVIRPFFEFDRSEGCAIYDNHDARMARLRASIQNSPYINERDMGCDSFYFHWLQRHAAREAIDFYNKTGLFLLDASTSTSEHCNRVLKSRCISLHPFTEKSCTPKYGWKNKFGIVMQEQRLLMLHYPEHLQQCEQSCRRCRAENKPHFGHTASNKRCPFYKTSKAYKFHRRLSELKRPYHDREAQR